jgi:hypothetical protein
MKKFDALEGRVSNLESISYPKSNPGQVIFSTVYFFCTHIIIIIIIIIFTFCFLLFYFNQ